MGQKVKSNTYSPPSPPPLNFGGGLSDFGKFANRRGWKN